MDNCLEFRFKAEETPFGLVDKNKSYELLSHNSIFIKK